LRPFSLTLYRWATALMSPLAPVLLRARARRGKEDLERLNERMGVASAPRPNGRLAWLHGASVGESLSLLPLIDGLQRECPALTILVTSGTVTSAHLMAKRLPDGVLHQYAPIDTPNASKRFFEHWKPDLTIVVESEIWPNLILQAKSAGSRLALLSGRLSNGSLERWSRAPRASKWLFGAFNLLMAQDDATAQRLTSLGGRDDGRLNLKRLGAPPPLDAKELDLLRTAADGQVVLLAASTHPGEDELVLDAFVKVRRDAKLVIVPRHPIRGGDIDIVARRAGLTAGLRSRGDPFGPAEVYIADTLGELGLWFSLADAAFIGGSLLPGPGGHNPVEAAQLGCPIITGPHLDNWREIYTDLFEADAAVRVDDAAMLCAAFADTVLDPPAVAARKDRARLVVMEGQEALSTAVQGLIGLLP
jgi:3-deoxy-D-manno-octulosonic-acid transferase